jgi:hypothetical protein
VPGSRPVTISTPHSRAVSRMEATTRRSSSSDSPSSRMKLIRLGVQDYEWLKMVSDAGDPDFARKVARELIPAAWKVPDDAEASRRLGMMEALAAMAAFFFVHKLQERAGRWLKLLSGSVMILLGLLLLLRPRWLAF